MGIEITYNNVKRLWKNEGKHLKSTNNLNAIMKNQEYPYGNVIYFIKNNISNVNDIPSI